MKQSDSPWLTLTESAEYEKRGRRWLAREAKAGRVKHARIGGRGEFMFRHEWLDEHMESMAVPVVVPVRRRA